MTLRPQAVVILAALIAAISPGEARSQADASRLRLETQSAYASLYDFERDGKLYYVNVFFEEFTEASNTVVGPPRGLAEVGIGIYDPDTFEPIFLGGFYGLIDRRDIRFRGMNSASLEVTVPLTDFDGEPAGDATVSLELEGVGPMDRQRFNTIEHFDGGLRKLLYDVRIRTMAPSGVVTVGDEVIPLDAALSEMTWTKILVISIILF